MLRTLARRSIPLPLRSALRTFVREIPVRLRDLPADLMSRESLPPARLRRGVARSSSRAEYLDIGERLAESLATFLGTHAPDAGPGDVLDFGCGSGRVARHFAGRRDVDSFTGVDIDREAVDWCSKHLPGRFLTIAPSPPAPFDDGSFDVVYAVSVFTHFDEKTQDAWLAELRRVLRTGGLLLASTHSPALTFERPDLTIDDHRALNATGFLFARGVEEFNSHSAFHSPDYLRAHWAQWFDFVAHEQHGLAGYQDLSLWRRR